jgi:hypothetical protein
MQIKWTDEDPETGKRRFLSAERFAGVWKFKSKLQRRGDWTQGLQPTKAMWEHIFDGLQRRYRRREGVTDEDLTQVERILKSWIEPRDLSDEETLPPNKVQR